jgi:hypothetical protein
MDLLGGKRTTLLNFTLECGGVDCARTAGAIIAPATTQTKTKSEHFLGARIVRRIY